MKNAIPIVDNGTFQLVICEGAKPELWFNREYTFDIDSLADFVGDLLALGGDHIFYEKLSSVFKDTENRISSDRAKLHPDLG